MTTAAMARPEGWFHEENETLLSVRDLRVDFRPPPDASTR